jgi:hypothetical protein
MSYDKTIAVLVLESGRWRPAGEGRHGTDDLRSDGVRFRAAKTRPTSPFNRCYLAVVQGTVQNRVLK